jgi:hypothetical protein
MCGKTFANVIDCYSHGQYHLATRTIMTATVSGLGAAAH